MCPDNDDCLVLSLFCLSFVYHNYDDYDERLVMIMILMISVILILDEDERLQNSNKLRKPHRKPRAISLAPTCRCCACHRDASRRDGISGGGPDLILLSGTQNGNRVYFISHSNYTSWKHKYNVL